MVTAEGVAATVSDSPNVAFKATLAVLEVSWQTAAGTARVSKASTEISFAGSAFLRLDIAIAPRHRFPVQHVARTRICFFESAKPSRNGRVTNDASATARMSSENVIVCRSENINQLTTEPLTCFAAGTLLKIFIFRPIQG